MLANIMQAYIMLAYIMPEIEEYAVQAQEKSGQKEGFRPVCLLIRHQLFKQKHKAE